MSLMPKQYPEMSPLYDIQRTYEENLAEGPFFEGTIPTRSDEGLSCELFGRELRSPVGIAAGPLLGSKWVALAAGLGFDLITYKTIRSKVRKSHPLPNILYLDAPEQLYLDDEGGNIKSLGSSPKSLSQVAITNSFGMPSQSRDYLEKDIEASAACLGKGQMLMVSVVGSPDAAAGFEQDFVDTALLAKACGAQAIEANLSCPNVSTGEGMLYKDTKAVERLCKSVSTAIGDLPLVVKVGPCHSIPEMRSLLTALARGGAQAICGINTVSMRIQDAEGNPALGPNRMSGGVCGAPIRTIALSFTRLASEVNRLDGLGLTILGVGGILSPNHIHEFLESGADAALSATGFMWDPYLAMRFHQTYSRSESYDLV